MSAPVKKSAGAVHLPSTRKEAIIRPVVPAFTLNDVVVVSMTKQCPLLDMLAEACGRFSPDVAAATPGKSCESCLLTSGKELLLFSSLSAVASPGDVSLEEVGDASTSRVPSFLVSTKLVVVLGSLFTVEVVTVLVLVVLVVLLMFVVVLAMVLMAVLVVLLLVVEPLVVLVVVVVVALAVLSPAAIAVLLVWFFSGLNPHPLTCL